MLFYLRNIEERSSVFNHLIIKQCSTYSFITHYAKVVFFFASIKSDHPYFHPSRFIDLFFLSPHHLKAIIYTFFSRFLNQFLFCFSLRIIQELSSVIFPSHHLRAIIIFFTSSASSIDFLFFTHHPRAFIRFFSVCII